MKLCNLPAAQMASMLGVMQVLIGNAHAGESAMRITESPQSRSFEEIFKLPDPFEARLVYLPCRFGAGWATDCKFDTGAPFASYAERKHPLPLSAGRARAKDLRYYERSGLSGGSSPCLKVYQPTLVFSGRRITLREPHTLAQCLSGSDENLVGLSVVEGRAWALDFKRKVFSWKGFGQQDWQPLHREGVPFLRMSLRFGSVSVKAIFDTGADFTVIADEFVKAHPGEFELVRVPGQEQTEDLMITRGEGPAAAQVHIRGGIPYLKIMDTSGKPFEAVLYKVKNPIGLGKGNVFLRGDYVLSHPFARFRSAFGPGVELVLGNNHIMQADWILDLQNARWAVRP